MENIYFHIDKNRKASYCNPSRMVNDGSNCCGISQNASNISAILDGVYLSSLCLYNSRNGTPISFPIEVIC